jgi:two-component system, OmpR family, response regulator
MENNKKYTVLLAEDDPHLGKILKYYLEARGYDVVLAVDGEEAINKFHSNKEISIVLLDVMMPLKDGFQIAKEIRQQNQGIPIIFTTAKALQTDILEGFRLGADDYLTKPFTMEELLARINAVILRAYKDGDVKKEKDTDQFHIGLYFFDHRRHVLKYDDIELKLTARESQLLKLLCNYSNQVLDRKVALELIWGEDNYFHSRSMDVYISKLRKYLKNDQRIELINIHGVGFKLVLPDE